MPVEIRDILVCPICKSRITATETSCSCTSQTCRAVFPIVNSVPILINEQHSIFRIKDFTADGSREEKRRFTLRDILKSLVPSITHNWVAGNNFSHLARLISSRSKAATILIVGAGEMGEGLEQLVRAPNVTIVETDVYIGRNTTLVADGHDLPFANQSVDAVVVQAVLEHVLDPFQCVEEIYRVLKLGGIVYAETPFLYPVHLGPNDFMRFSQSGHRRLFRRFGQIDAGVVGGPGMALAVSLRSFVRSLSASRLVDVFATLAIPFLVFWLKYLDYFLISKPHVADYAAGTFFLGVKSDAVLPDSEIIEGHWSRRGAKR